MSLSKKIAAALDENTRAYVMPCTVTVDDGPHRVTLHLTALDTVGAGLFRRSSLRPRAAPSGPRKRSMSGVTGSPAGLLTSWSRSRSWKLMPEGARFRSAARARRPVTPSAATTKCGSSARECCACSGSRIDEATRQRRESPCQLTREVLERLADDIAASVV